MKKFITLSLGLSILFNAQNTFAQNLPFCGSDEAEKMIFDQYPELLKKALERDKEYAKLDALEASTGYASQRQQSVVYVIPVVFHIIHQNGPENLSDAKIREAVNVMNQDFRKLNPDTGATIPAFKSLMADCEIEFRLAELDPNGNCTNGINRAYSWQTNNGGESAKLIKWPPNKYLNIWVVKNMSSAHANAAAYSYTPGNAPTGGDGVICLYNYVGTNNGNSHTLSHEVGHYLNLKHPWGSTNSPNVACGDDMVSDTPITKGSNLSCNLNLAACNPPTLENVQNFMDYSFCSTMYTLGQKTRMRAALTSSVAGRNNLWSSANLTATGTGGPSVLCAADFVSNTPSGVTCQNGLISLSDLSYNGRVTSRTWSCPGAVLSGSSTFNDSVLTVQYNTPGLYDVTLTASNSVSSVSITKSQFITVLPQLAAYQNGSYSESFESSALPNSDWEVTSPDFGNVNWTQNTAAFTSGVASAFIENYSADSADVDELIGPTINIQAISNPVFTFKLAFRQKTSSDNDALKIWTSNDCGRNWSLRKTISGASLATATPASTTYFIPTATQWRQETVSIANLLSSTNARIKFQLISGAGNNLYIDDINIIGNTGLIENTDAALKFSIVPNPSTGNSVLRYELTKKEDLSYELIDVLGNSIEHFNWNDLSSGLYTQKIAENISLPAGLYFVRLSSEGKTSVQKLVIHN